MAKAKKVDKGERRASLTELVRQIDALVGTVRLHRADAERANYAFDQRLRGNEEAICPRVAARLTALERHAMRDVACGVSQENGLDSLCRVVDQNAEESTKLMRRLELQEREQSRLARDVETLLSRQQFTEAGGKSSIPRDPAAVGMKYQASADGWLISCIMVDAKKLSRAARHELIVKLTDLNRGA